MAITAGRSAWSRPQITWLLRPSEQRSFTVRHLREIMRCRTHVRVIRPTGVAVSMPSASNRNLMSRATTSSTRSYEMTQRMTQTIKAPTRPGRPQQRGIQLRLACQHPRRPCR